MASDRAPGRRVRRCLALVALASAGAPAAWAQAPASGSSGLIFNCVLNGKRLTSDRPIHDCSHIDQRVLNSDGSLNRIHPPTLTPEERARQEQRQLEAEAAEVARKDAARRDRNLMHRYPDEAAHARGRAKALDDIRLSVRNSEARIAQLTADRKPLEAEKEFYVGKPLPTKLKLALDSNEATLEAQKALVQNQQTEVGRINALYDAELQRLRKLWAGATAGSLPPLPATLDGSKAGTKADVGKGASSLQVDSATRVKSP